MKKKIEDSRFLKWLKDNGHIPDHYGKRNFEDPDLEAFWRNKQKDKTQ